MIKTRPTNLRETGGDKLPHISLPCLFGATLEKGTLGYPST